MLFDVGDRQQGGRRKQGGFGPGDKQRPCGTPGMVNSGGTLLQMAGCHVEGGMALHAHSAHTVYNLLTVEPGCTSTQLTEKQEATISRD